MFYALEPSSQYEVVIQSQNRWGWSENSEPFFFSTRANGKYHYIFYPSLFLTYIHFATVYKIAHFDDNLSINMNHIKIFKIQVFEVVFGTVEKFLQSNFEVVPYTASAADHT